MLAVPNVASVPEYALDRMGRFARALLKYLRGAFREILSVWRYELIEFGGEADHVHLLAAIHPALNLSTLINNLKTASARRARNRFRAHLARFYCKPCFWHRAYYVGSVGEASLETVKAYVETQGTTERHRKTTARPPPGRVA
jgi:putative transposase